MTLEFGFEALPDEHGVFEGRELATQLIATAYQLLVPYAAACPAVADDLFSIISDRAIREQHEAARDRGRGCAGFSCPSAQVRSVMQAKGRILPPHRARPPNYCGNWLSRSRSTATRTRCKKLELPPSSCQVTAMTKRKNITATKSVEALSPEQAYSVGAAFGSLLRVGMLRRIILAIGSFLTTWANSATGSPQRACGASSIVHSSAILRF